MHKISRSPGLRLRGAYNATRHAIAGFRGEGPRERDGKREGREENGKVMEGRGGRGSERMDRRGSKERRGTCSISSGGIEAPFLTAVKRQSFLRFSVTQTT